MNIQNPSKKLVVNCGIRQIINSLAKIKDSNIFSYHYVSHDYLLNWFRFSSFEFLSVGVYIDITLVEISDNKTEVCIEISRKVGTFNKWYEIQNANNHIFNFLNLLSNIINGNDIVFNQSKNNNDNNMKNILLFSSLSIFVLLITMKILHIY